MRMRRILELAAKLLPALVAIAVCTTAALYGAGYAREHDSLKAQVSTLTEANQRLAASNAALSKLRSTALRMGSEPVQISGTLWVVVEGSVQ